jgi:hypothetical protein
VVGENLVKKHLKANIARMMFGEKGYSMEQHLREGLDQWEKEVANYLFTLDATSVKPFKTEVKQLRNYLNKQWESLSDKREVLIQKQIKGLAKASVMNLT